MAANKDRARKRVKSIPIKSQDVLDLTVDDSGGEDKVVRGSGKSKKKGGISDGGARKKEVGYAFQSEGGGSPVVRGVNRFENMDDDEPLMVPEYDLGGIDGFGGYSDSDEEEEMHPLVQAALNILPRSAAGSRNRDASDGKSQTASLPPSSSSASPVKRKREQHDTDGDEVFVRRLSPRQTNFGGVPLGPTTSRKLERPTTVSTSELRPTQKSNQTPSGSSQQNFEIEELKEMAKNLLEACQQHITFAERVLEFLDRS